MNKLEQAAKQALDALTDFFNTYPHMLKACTEDAADALCAALEEAQKSARQPLTDEEIIALGDKARAAEGGDAGYILPISFARAVEKAHGIGGEV